MHAYCLQVHNDKCFMNFHHVHFDKCAQVIGTSLHVNNLDLP